MTSTREPLVTEERLSRAWSAIVDRVPGQLDEAVPDAWVQPETEREVRGQMVKVPAQAVFAVAEPNPRHFNHMQVSVIHVGLDGWQEMEREVGHFVSGDRDPLAWCLFQAAKGHLVTMNNIRQMSHPVTRINEKGEIEKTYPTGGRH